MFFLIMAVAVLFIFLYLFFLKFYKLFRLTYKTNRFTKFNTKDRDILLDVTKEVNSRMTKLNIKPSEIKLKKLEYDLKRTNSKLTPEMFATKQYIMLISCISIGLLVGIAVKGTTGYILGVTGIIAGFMMYFESVQELNKKIEEQNKKIILEFPRFIKTIQYSPENKIFTEILKDYIKNSKSGLKYDLTLLLADIETGIEESQAITRFANRIQIPEVKEFASVLQVLNTNKEDSVVSLQFLENKFRKRINDMVEKELKKRPKTLEILNEILLNTLAFILLVPIAIDALSGLLNIIN